MYRVNKYGMSIKRSRKDTRIIKIVEERRHDGHALFFFEATLAFPPSFPTPVIPIDRFSPLRESYGLFPLV